MRVAKREQLLARSKPRSEMHGELNPVSQQQMHRRAVGGRWGGR